MSDAPDWEGFSRDLTIDWPIADLPAQNVRVKPLKWSDWDEQSNYPSCDALGKHSYWYKAEEYGSHVRVYLSDDCWRHKTCIGAYDTLEVAKAAAQADYETHIMVALEPADPLDDGDIVAHMNVASLHSELMATKDKLAKVEAELHQRKTDNKRWRTDTVNHTNELITLREAAEAALTADPLEDPRVVAMVEALHLARAALSGENVNMSVVKRKVNVALTDALAAYKARFIDLIEDDT